MITIKKFTNKEMILNRSCRTYETYTQTKKSVKQYYPFLREAGPEPVPRTADWSPTPLPVFIITLCQIGLPSPSLVGQAPRSHFSPISDALSSVQKKSCVPRPPLRFKPLTDREV